MGTATDKLNYLLATKEEIRTAIIGRGVAVPEGTTFRQYAALIGSIAGAGENGGVVLPDTPEGTPGTTIIPNTPENIVKPSDPDTPVTPYDPDKPEEMEVPKNIIEKETGQSADTFDVMILQNGTGDVTYGFLEKGLPALLSEPPEWDKETYPYAYYAYDVLWQLVVSSEPMYWSESGKLRGGGTGQYCLIIQDKGRWDSKWYTSDLNYIKVLWCNTDVLNADGTVYLAASDPTEQQAFEITWYDPATTNFKAKGWRRLSYHRQGDYWQSDDFTTVESGGWNYLKHITECTREKLYYKGVEVWPDTDAMWHTWFDGEVINGHTIDSSSMGSFSMLGRKWSRVTVDGVSEILPIVSPNVSPRWIGNPYLYDQSYEDNGYNFCVYQTGTANTTICFRQGETHNIKIEGAVYLNE